MTDQDRLARYDRLYADLAAERDRLTAKMAELKAAGRSKSATYRQLMGERMTVQAILSRFEVYGLPGRE